MQCVLKMHVLMIKRVANNQIGLHALGVIYFKHVDTDCTVAACSNDFTDQSLDCDQVDSILV